MDLRLAIRKQRPATHQQAMRPAFPVRSLWRWNLWSSQIARRYGMVGNWDALEKTLRMLPPSAQISVPAADNPAVAVTVNQAWSLRLDLTLPIVQQMIVAYSTQQTQSPAPTQPGAASTDSVFRRLERSKYVIRDSELVERILTHHTRRDAIVEAPEIAPVERILVATPTVTAQTIPATPAPIPTMPGSRPAAAFQYWDQSSSHGVTQVNPVDIIHHINVERLTDQVMQTIDQRVVAARERFGGK